MKTAKDRDKENGDVLHWRGILKARKAALPVPPAVRRNERQQQKVGEELPRYWKVEDRDKCCAGVFLTDCALLLFQVDVERRKRSQRFPARAGSTGVCP